MQKIFQFRKVYYNKTNIVSFAFLCLFHLTSYAQEICDNGIDDDLDGLIDINDTDCDCSVGSSGPVSGIIPNPSFESYVNCPTSFAQLNEVNNWMQAGNGTSDYFNCSYLGVIGGIFGPATPNVSAGTGYVGYNYSGGTGNSNEFIGTCLNTPFLAGVTYTLQFNVSHGGGLTGGASYDPDLVLYGTNSCADLPWLGSCPPASFQILGSSGIVNLPGNNTWQQGQITFTPTIDISGIALGGLCGTVSGSPGYYYLDELVLTSSSPVLSSTITEQGGWCTNDLSLTAVATMNGGSWQWYKDGVALVGETSSSLNVIIYGAGVYSTVYTLNGDCFRQDHILNPAELPDADFNFTVGCGTVEFFNTSTVNLPSSLTSANWSFGDGSSSIISDPTHTFSNSGTYNVTLTVTDNNGCVDMFAQSVTVPQFSLPSASDPVSITVSCINDIPFPDPLVVTDETGTGNVLVVHVSDMSDGNSCPEIITRTYSITDDCGTIYVTQSIIVNDTIPPVLSSPPLNLTVQCLEDVPSPIELNWTDNCSGMGAIISVDDTLFTGNCNGEILRKWSITDVCGNIDSVTQTIFINDDVAPVVTTGANDLILPEGHQVPVVDINSLTGYTDNCWSDVSVSFISESIDSTNICDQIVIDRSFSVTDACNNQTLLDQQIIIPSSLPEASFTSSIQQITSLDNAIFNNTSTNASFFQWFVNDEAVSNQFNLDFTFPSTTLGSSTITLVALNEWLCSDTAQLILEYVEEVVFYVPNSFTPDGDEYNNTFKPVMTSGIDYFDYELTIFNRWGEVVFVSNDVNVGWDGSYDGKSLVKSDIYTWVIFFKEQNTDERKRVTGHVSLLR